MSGDVLLGHLGHLDVPNLDLAGMRRGQIFSRKSFPASLNKVETNIIGGKKVFTNFSKIFTPFKKKKNISKNFQKFPFF
jgi:hypothetical protein